MDMTVYRLFSGMFLTSTVNVINRQDSKSLDAVASLDKHVNVKLLTWLNPVIHALMAEAVIQGADLIRSNLGLSILLTDARALTSNPPITGHHALPPELQLSTVNVLEYDEETSFV